MTRFAWNAAAVWAMVAATATASLAAQSPELPRAHTVRELGIGFAAGVAGALALGKLSAEVSRLIHETPPPRHDDQIGALAAVGGLTGHILGSSVGVYAAGRQASVRESFGTTVAGAAIGEIAGIVGLTAILGAADGDDRALLPAYATMAVAAPIGATIAFNRSRKTIGAGATSAAPIAIALRFRF